MPSFSRRALLAAACLLPLTSVIHAGEVPKSAREKFRAFLKSSDMAVGEFTQTVTDKTGREAAAPSSGYFRFMRPGRFEWTYVKPYRQEIMSDGQTLWIHDPDLYQVTVKKLTDALPSTPAAMLFGDPRFEEDWHLRDVSDTVLEATPKKPDGGFDRVTISFDDKGALTGMVLVDGFGQSTVLTVRGFRRETLEPSSFVMKIPEGTDVVESAL